MPLASSILVHAAVVFVGVVTVRVMLLGATAEPEPAGQTVTPLMEILGDGTPRCPSQMLTGFATDPHLLDIEGLEVDPSYAAVAEARAFDARHAANFDPADPREDATPAPAPLVIDRQVVGFTGVAGSSAGPRPGS